MICDHRWEIWRFYSEQCYYHYFWSMRPNSYPVFHINCSLTDASDRINFGFMWIQHSTDQKPTSILTVLDHFRLSSFNFIPDFKRRCNLTQMKECMLFITNVMIAALILHPFITHQFQLSAANIRCSNSFQHQSTSNKRKWDDKEMHSALFQSFIRLLLSHFLCSQALY